MDIQEHSTKSVELFARTKNVNLEFLTLEFTVEQARQLFYLVAQARVNNITEIDAAENGAISDAELGLTYSDEEFNWLYKWQIEYQMMYQVIDEALTEIGELNG